MLENWVWNKESLKLLSAHFKDSSPIEDKLLDDLIKSRDTYTGLANMKFVSK